MNRLMKNGLLMAIGTLAMSTSHAASVDLALTRIAGTVADGTAIFRGELSSAGFNELFSITLVDSNSQIGGSNGQYSGFDLDAIKLSRTYATTAMDASSAESIDEFDFSPSGTIFTPGTQRPPVDEKLAGTDDTGAAVDADFATLDTFDADYFGPGSVTLGDGGTILFNLNNPVSTEGLYIYIGEVSGDLGEALDGTLTVSDVAPVPVPGALWLFGSAFVAMIGVLKRKD